jgi:hypothetical protein
MPDLQQFSVTRAGTVSLPNVPTWTVSFQVTNSKTGAVIRDFTGANAFSFPQVFAQFSAADQDDLVSRWVMDMIRKKAPDLFG